jgi:hypothetical protein
MSPVDIEITGMVRFFLCPGRVTTIAAPEETIKLQKKSPLFIDVYFLFGF